VAFTIDTSTEFGRRVAERIESESVAWLTTVDSRGRPQPNPVWFLWFEGQFVIYSEPDKPKLANIRRNPGVSLHLNTINGGGVIVFTGTAEIVDRAALPPGATDAFMEKYEETMLREGWTLDWMPSQYSETILMSPEKVRGF
jgi:PPOX class probable F420-dependent enzyme